MDNKITGKAREGIATTITLPTEAQLQDTLAGIERLMTAKAWERAAIVYAFTTDDDPGGRPTRETRPEVGRFPTSITAFAGMGFHGLRSRETVARYRKTWQRAIDNGYAIEVGPGDVVNLPTVPWGEHYDPTEGDNRYNIPGAAQLRAQAEVDGAGPAKVLDVAKNPAAVYSAVVAGSPELADRVLKALQVRGDMPDLETMTALTARLEAAEARATAAEEAIAEQVAAQVTAKAAELASDARSQAAALARQLADAEGRLDTQMRGGRATAKELTTAKAARDNARQLAEAAEQRAAKMQSELQALRADPARVARATSTQQYEWMIRPLLAAHQNLAGIDNRLDREPTVLEGEDLTSVLETGDRLAIRWTSIKLKLGAEFSVPE